jgi:hypothetical protein
MNSRSRITANHNQTLILKAGRVTGNHNQTLVRKAS